MVRLAVAVVAGLSMAQPSFRSQTVTVSNTAEIPAVAAHGRHRAIKVEVHRPRHTVAARRGFVAH